MKKVLWLSRHPLNDDQLQDLKRILGDRIEVKSENITWEATEDPYFDRLNNKLMWLDLIRESRIICGVFPPVSIEALTAPGDNPCLDKELVDIALYSPVSKQDKKIREDGSAQIEFKHLRWCRIH